MRYEDLAAGARGAVRLEFQEPIEGRLFHSGVVENGSAEEAWQCSQP